MNTSPKHSNRLVNSSSPYLQQHANNPVDWYEWGEEALEKARVENKPMIISIGYAACHWCHVMEDESFMDVEVAKLMNDHFISIKVDREERPDIDQIYMLAAQLLSGRGGWPLNAFALPDGRPFFAGTYFPKQNWKSLLHRINDLFKNEKQKLLYQAQHLTRGIHDQNQIKIPASEENHLDKKIYLRAFENWKSQFDLINGGFRGAPKFPMPISWEYVAQYLALTEDHEARSIFHRTLTSMGMGGIYDHLGGGFARYSVDEYWFAPHFEKMLYDNGQLVSLYSKGYQLNKSRTYKRIIEKTLEFIEREMLDGSGGFYSSLNADSEGEEGKFYVWTYDEVVENIEPEFVKKYTSYYNIEKTGNWENGVNIPYRKYSPEDYAEENNIDSDEWFAKSEQLNKKLLAIRNQRERPSTDDKILTSWNALMLIGYLDAYKALGNNRYLKIARKNADFLIREMINENGSVWRNYKPGQFSNNTRITGFLDDYSFLALAMIQLYGVTFEKPYLNIAQKITEYAIEHFYDAEQKFFFYNSSKSETLFSRSKEIEDNVIPSSNSAMAHVLYDLSIIFDQKSFYSIAKNMLEYLTPDLKVGGPHYGNWLCLLGKFTHPNTQIAIVGQEAVVYARQMQKLYLPFTTFMGSTNEENLPLLQNKQKTSGTHIYVCEGKTCYPPVEDIESALDRLHPKKGNT